MIDVKKYEGMVKGPGKFEGCSPEGAYFWDIGLEFGDGESLAGLDEDGHFAEKFTVDAEEADAFGLEIGSTFVTVEDQSGFVYGMSLAQYEGWKS